MHADRQHGTHLRLRPQCGTTPAKIRLSRSGGCTLCQKAMPFRNKMPADHPETGQNPAARFDMSCSLLFEVQAFDTGCAGCQAAQLRPDVFLDRQEACVTATSRWMEPHFGSVGMIVGRGGDRPLCL
jgi:hypothetical protein